MKGSKEKHGGWKELKCPWCGVGMEAREMGLVDNKRRYDIWCGKCRGGLMYVGGVLDMVWYPVSYNKRPHWAKVPDGTLFAGKVKA